MVHDKKKIKVTYIKLDGYIDAETAVDFENSLQALLQQGKRLVLLDCREIRYVSDAGIGALISAQRLFRDQKSCLVFYNLSEEVAQVARFLNLHEELSLAQDRKRALQIVAQCAREFNLLVEAASRQVEQTPDEELAPVNEKKLDLGRGTEAQELAEKATEKAPQKSADMVLEKADGKMETHLEDASDKQESTPKKIDPSPSQSDNKPDKGASHTSSQLQQAMRNALTKSSKVALSPAKPSTQEPNKAPFEEGEMPRVYDRDEPLTVDKVDNDADKPVEFEDIVPDNQGLMAELAEAGISEYQEAEWHLRQREEPIHALMEDFYHQPQQGAKGRPSDDLYRSGEANLEQRQTAQQHEQPPELDEIAPQKGEQGDEGADSGSSISAQDQVGPQGESQPPRQSTDLSEIWPVMVKCAHCGEISKAPEPGNYACPYCDSEFIVSESGKLFFQVETDESL